jgi:hypothetical protein
MDEILITIGSVALIFFLFLILKIEINEAKFRE